MADAAPALRVRLVSALVMAPVALVMVMLGGWAFSLLIALVLVVMAAEWRHLTRVRLGNGGWTAALAVGAGLLVLVLGALERPGEAFLVLLLGTGVSVAVARIVEMPALWPSLGVLYLGLPALALVWLRGLPEIGGEVLVWLLVVVWTTDSAAYFAGRRFGGPRLAPLISPHKTWSGLFGGVLGGGLVGVVVAALAGSDRLVHAAVLGAVLAVVSQIGDLTESALKRCAGVKDSGGLIPGHGGVLDRIDGLLFAAPALALFVLLVGPRAWP